MSVRTNTRRFFLRARRAGERKNQDENRNWLEHKVKIILTDILPGNGNRPNEPDKETDICIGKT